MNEFEINRTYSYLKDSCKVLYKELSIMKDKNDSINQRVEDLQSTISSILQYSITKEEMKEIIKEGLTPITNMLIGKEKVNAETQTENIDNISKPFNLYKQTQHKHPGCLTCILELLDRRIAVSCYEGSISLNQMNYETKEWKVLAHRDKAHVVR